ncbi:hypothetical protein PHMEG_00010947 [Phytophthora megakarya]|uniref:Uncharacterized protein n=1 Tax=Phytophthora megakarya TaxID=4795 RepID=A0A225WE44_9STRA|nr:hypothetical protein PHMEG_00010947 [Phytophthora megakarya]
MYKNIDPEGNGGDKLSREDTLINPQNFVISKLVAKNQALELEKPQAQRDEDISVSMTRAEPGAVGNFEWYAKAPRLWDVCEKRQTKSTYNQIVNYMKLFLPYGFKLDPSSPTYCDYRKSGSPVLNQLRKYYHEDKLDALITEFRARVAIEITLDRAPCETQDWFERASILSIEDIVTYRDFKTLCMAFAQAAKLRILDASIRALRNSMIQTIVTRDRVPEALRAILVTLKDKCKAKSNKKKRGLVELDDIEE